MTGNDEKNDLHFFTLASYCELQKYRIFVIEEQRKINNLWHKIYYYKIKIGDFKYANYVEKWKWSLYLNYSQRNVFWAPCLFEDKTTPAKIL